MTSRQSHGALNRRLAKDFEASIASAQAFLYAASVTITPRCKPRRAPMSKPIERVEIITGIQRRRRYTAEEKVRLVEETMQPGMTVSAVARLHGVSQTLRAKVAEEVRLGTSGLQAGALESYPP